MLHISFLTVRTFSVFARFAERKNSTWHAKSLSGHICVIEFFVFLFYYCEAHFFRIIATVKISSNGVNRMNFIRRVIYKKWMHVKTVHLSDNSQQIKIQWITPRSTLNWKFYKYTMSKTIKCECLCAFKSGMKCNFCNIL